MKTNYMTIRQFREKYSIVANQSFRDAISLLTSKNGYKGLKSNLFFINNEYAYPEKAMIKIAMALGIKYKRPDINMSIKQEMSVYEFRKLVPDLSNKFGMRVAQYARNHRIKNETTPYKYPIAILIKFAKLEGKEIPQILLNNKKTEVQPCEQQEKQPYEPANDLKLQELREIKQILAALLAAWKGEQS